MRQSRVLNIGDIFKYLQQDFCFLLFMLMIDKVLRLYLNDKHRLESESFERKVRPNQP